MPFRRRDFKPILGRFEMPEKYEEMLELANQIAKKISCAFVRIDLYSVYGKIYFSEITFTPCAGTLPFEPAEWDRIIGSWIHLPMDEG